MKHYPHHIGDFDKATRHLTRIERSIYRDLLDMYYDTEYQIPLDIDSVCRKIIARSNEESTAVQQVLNEFFIKTEHGWYHERCESEIAAYRANSTQKALAGKASAEAKRQRKEKIINSRSTAVQQPLNSVATEAQRNSTNQEPRTINQEPLTNIKKHTSSDVDSVFSYWCKTMQMRNAKLTSKRKKCIEDRIKEGYLLTDIFDAINGCASSGYHMGQNDTGTVYNDLTLILRSGDKLEQFIQKLTPVKPNPTTQNGGPGYGRKLSLAERTELETAKVLAMCEAEEAGYGSVAAYESALREQVGDGPGRRFSGGSVHGELLTLVSENGEAKR